MAADIEKIDVTVEAVRFEGGVENAVEILQWVSDKDGSGNYLEPTPAYEIGDDHQTAQPEYLVINTTRGSVLVKAGEYVIYGPEKTFFSVDSEQYAKEYHR